MNYLNQDHTFFEQSKLLCSDAISDLLEFAYQSSHKFRLQFDTTHLEHIIGRELFSRLMPNFFITNTKKTWSYDIYEDTLNDEKIEILRKILSLNPTEYSERPLNYIKSVRLLNKAGNTVLRMGDHSTFILFDLPKPENNMLLERYRQKQIPEDVIENVDVNLEDLDP